MSVRDLDTRDQQMRSQALERAWIWDYDAEAEGGGCHGHSLG